MIARAALRRRWWTASVRVWTGRDDDRVAGVDAERVDVLHRAHGDARVVGVAHDLVLDLLPADEALLDHDLADRAGAQAGPDDLAVRRLGLDDAAAGAAQREGRADDGRQADRRERAVSIVLASALDDLARGVRLADPVEQVAERLAVLGHVDGLERACPGAGSRGARRRRPGPVAVARLSAVWPPRPASRPSGCSRAMTASTASTVSGSR